MTKSDIITFCTEKLGITDAAAQAQAGRFVDLRHSMIWNEHDWRQARWQETIAVAAGTQDVTLDAQCELVRGARWAGQQELLALNDAAALALDAPGYDQPGPVLAFTPLGKDTAGRPVIRLQRKPAKAGTLLVFGKRRPVPLGANDTPPIPGEEQALCEWVLGDLYEWLRQLGKAQVFFQKGIALVERMRQLEAEQSGEVRRIVPYVQQLDGDGCAGDSYNPLA